MNVHAVIPAYKEEKRIAAVVREALLHAARVIVVDDGSGDGTAAAAEAAGADVLRHAVNRGQGAALRTGTEWALLQGADIVVHLDADGQHDPAGIDALVAPIREGKADVVFGSRFLGLDPVGMPPARRILLAAARAFNRLILGIPRELTDPQSGLRALSATAARRIDFRQGGMAHCSEILRLVTRSGLRWREVPAQVRYTQDTLAKGQKATDAFKIVWHLFLGTFQR